ncbi:hypothetical protein A3G63_01800 [Candidatus Kaiserbacteria bacterium RIFCSPLOWO2_12_FULL_52_8]|uniref:Alpha/beta hydrolase n=1 Tax=Candidatus Kaiserbacteria bacterium RIFCSPHIGHO2_01_FULL_53_31 TaxID=1798481 RepID=A0A1F6CIB4_9BACT|nr:MAG: hypothetical protein A2678_02705 [Candidatus Kaiserbacteria bacterium RIFCSPHIGHO2_01_FULL_53_31]OGG94426.1 MAG: hypothetical protein A3G63_01800 [Candidatus Kaiserbacteria bacterium RIFCSPLOWO2_12_FULL_52_8]
MKRTIIVHGWADHPENAWFPWLKTELDKKGYEVEVPVMPDAKRPVITAWVGHLSTLLDGVGPNDELTLIGHSIGCQTILRTLEITRGLKIKKVILVAGWLTLTNLETSDEENIAAPWLTAPIDFDKVRSAADSFTAILSDNDQWVPLEKTKKAFESKLGARVIVEHGRGHFAGDDGVTELPVILTEIQS